jgi:hypothetical protein
MAGKSNVSLGNLALDTMLSVSATYPTLSGGASATTTLTVPGVQLYDMVSWNMYAPPAHLVLDNMYVSAANTLTILWGTDSTGLGTGGSVTLLLGVTRVAETNLGLSQLPSALV